MELKGQLKHLLFTTKTCPNCPTAKRALEEAGIKYEVVDATENRELVKEFKVMQAPTLVTVNGDEVKKYVNASNIKKFAENYSLMNV